MRCSAAAAHHDPADGAVAGVEDVVEALGQQGRGLRDAALDDGDRVGVEVLRQQPGHGGGGRGGQFAGLDDDRVAGGERADQRGEQELERVVPGRDDEDDAERVVLRPGRGVGAEVCGDRGGLGAQPAVEVVQGVVDLADGEVDLGAEGFRGALAEVRVEGGGQLLAVLGEQFAQPARAGRAPRDGLGAAGSGRWRAAGRRRRRARRGSSGSRCLAHGALVRWSRAREEQARRTRHVCQPFTRQNIFPIHGYDRPPSVLHLSRPPQPSVVHLAQEGADLDRQGRRQCRLAPHSSAESRSDAMRRRIPPRNSLCSA